MLPSLSKIKLIISSSKSRPSVKYISIIIIDKEFRGCYSFYHLDPDGFIVMNPLIN